MLHLLNEDLVWRSNCIHGICKYTLIHYLQLDIYYTKTSILTHTALAILGLLVALVTKASEGAQSVLTETTRATQSLIEATLINIWRTNEQIQTVSDALPLSYLFQRYIKFLQSFPLFSLFLSAPNRWKWMQWINQGIITDNVWNWSSWCKKKQKTEIHYMKLWLKFNKEDPLWVNDSCCFTLLFSVTSAFPHTFTVPQSVLISVCPFQPSNMQTTSSPSPLWPPGLPASLKRQFSSTHPPSTRWLYSMISTSI